MPNLLFPPRLQPGDALSLVAPAGPVNANAMQRAVSLLEQAGFECRTYGELTRRCGFLAGSDSERLAEFNAAIADPETRAILPVRGGYGVSRIVHQIDYEGLRKRPKLIAGFSDISALHAAVYAKLGLVTFHSPNLQDGIGHVDGLPAAVADSYWQMLGVQSVAQDSPANAALPNVECMTAGVGHGPLLGGNLAVFAGLMGSPYEPDTRGAILLLEDIGEAPYRIDRMLCQLRLAGKLDNLAGVVLGQFTDCDDSGLEAGISLDEIIENYFSGLGVPVIANYPVGHVRDNLTVPLGIPVCLDATACRLSVQDAYKQLDFCQENV